MDNYRKAKLTLVIGATGTGKTTLVKQILASAYQRALIVTLADVDYHEKNADGSDRYPVTQLNKPEDYNFDDIRRHIFEPKNTLRKISAFKNGIIVLDDCRMYLNAAIDPKLHALLVMRRHIMTDIIAVAHGFNEVPPTFYTFADDIFLFQTTENMVRRRNHVQNFDQLKQLQDQVNSEAKINPHYYSYYKFR